MLTGFRATFPERPLQVFVQSCFLAVVAGSLCLVCTRHEKLFSSHLLYGVYALCTLIFARSLWIIGSILLALRERSEALKDLPGPEYSLFGLIWALRVKAPHRLAVAWANEFGPIIKLRILMFHAVMITDPALACHVLNSAAFDKFPFLYNYLGPLLGHANLLSSPTDAHWRGVRKSVAPAFSPIHMRDATSVVVGKALHLVSILTHKGPGTPFNMDWTLLHLAADVIGQFGFQKDVNAMASIAARELGQTETSEIDCLLGVTLEIEKSVQQPLRALDPSKRAERKQGRFLIRQYKAVLDSVYDHCQNTNLRKGSFADLLLKAKNPVTGPFLDLGKGFSEAAMKGEVAALFFAGMDTTAHSNTWVLYLISQNADALAKIEAELDTLGLLATAERPNPRSLDYTDVAKLVYLQAAIKEALRMYPPLGLGQIRMSPHEVTLGQKLRIPKGTLVWVPHHGIMNTEHNWENPEQFIPERFLEPGAEFAQKLRLDPSWYEGVDLGDYGLSPKEALKRSTGSKARQPKRYFPFAEGPRNCVGQSLAKLSMVATAAVLLSHFKFRLADKMGGPKGVDEKEMYALITNIEGGMWMHAVPRLQH